MYTQAINRQPGKFEYCISQMIGEVLYDYSLDGYCEDELSREHIVDWYGLIMGSRYGYILHEDNQGFVTYSTDSISTIQYIWDNIINKENDL